MRTRAAHAGIALAVAVSVSVAGCTGDDDPQPVPTAADPTPVASTSGSPPTDDAGFDCDVVAAAQQELNDASDAELSRLGIAREDPQAFSVVVLVASQQAAQYWQTVETAALASLGEQESTDLRLVTGYWTAIDAELDAIEVADDSEAAVQAAETELAEITGRFPQRELGPAQQRLQDALAAACGTEPAAAASP